MRDETYEIIDRLDEIIKKLDDINDVMGSWFDDDKRQHEERLKKLTQSPNVQELISKRVLA